MRASALVLSACMLCCVILGGCPNLPVAEFSSFGDPLHTNASFTRDTSYFSTSYDGCVGVKMRPKENPNSRREGLSIEGFHSPSGSKGRAFIHYPKGWMELGLVAYDVNKAKSDMIYEWLLMQKGRVVQEIQVRVAPGSPVKVFISPRKVFIDEHEISVEQN